MTDQSVQEHCLPDPVLAQRKTVCLVRKDLDVRTVANVIGHCALALGAQTPEALVAHPVLTDGDGLAHSGVSGWPFVVLTTRASKLARTVSEVTEDDRLTSVGFMLPMLTTSNDDQLAGEVLATSTSAIEWFGVMAYGDIAAVDFYFSAYSLWIPKSVS